jgi:hypothetical protein
MHSAHPPATRRRRIVAAVAGLTILAATPAAVSSAEAATTAQPSAGQPTTAGIPGTSVAAGKVKIPGNVRLYQTRHSLLGLHKWYRQYKGNHPVVGGWWGWHRDKHGHVTFWDGRKQVGKLADAQPELTAPRRRPTR